MRNLCSSFNMDKGLGDDGHAPSLVPPRRPLAYHRSLTSPYPSSKLGALRHPSQKSTPPSGYLPDLPESHKSNRRSTQSQSEHNEEVSERNFDASRSTAWSKNQELSDAGGSAQSPVNKHRSQDIQNASVSAARQEELSPALMKQRDTLKVNVKSVKPDADQDMLSSQILFADTMQMPISTLLQLIPPHLLDPSHERLSPMSLQVPVTSIQALLESCRTLNWLCGQGKRTRHTDAPAVPSVNTEDPTTDFDILELVQRACDLVSGQAAERDIDVVLLQDLIYGVSLNSKERRINAEQLVRGDEGLLRFVILQMLTRTIEIAKTGSTIEIYLDTFPAGEGTLNNKIQISLLSDERKKSPDLEQSLVSHAHITRKVLDPFVKKLPGSIEVTQVGEEHFSSTLQLSFSLKVSNSTRALHELPAHEFNARQRFLPALRLAEEPRVEDLSIFVKSVLSGSRIALHGKPNRSFIRHLTSFLSSCGCETAILSTDKDSTNSSNHWTSTPFEGNNMTRSSGRTAVALSGNRPSLVSFPSDRGMGNEVTKGPGALAGQSSKSAVLDPVTGVPVSVGRLSPSAIRPTNAVAEEQDNASSELVSFSFVMIDDDLDVLQRELLRIRSAVSTLRSALSTKAGMSKNGSENKTGQAPDAGTYAIIFFFSLSNYRPVRDTVQCIVESSQQSNTPMPEILMIPKPCGSRRLLTALHTAYVKPLVDPFFSPIATSPMSPASRGLRKDLWGNMHGTLEENGGTHTPQPTTIQMPSPQQQEHYVPMRHEKEMPSRSADRFPSLHIEMPPTPSFEPKLDAKSALKEESRLESNPSSRPESQPDPALMPTEARHSLHTDRKHGTLQTPYHTSSGTSPMITDALEYFSETAAKLGSDGAAGYMIQTPDGRPAGIFFQPKVAGNNANRANVSSRRSSGEDNTEVVSHTPSQNFHARKTFHSARTNSDERKGDSDLGRTSKKRNFTTSSSVLDPEQQNNTQGQQSSMSMTTLPLDLSSPHGNIFTPEVGLHAILQSDKPPTATSLADVDKGRKEIALMPSSNGTAATSQGSTEAKGKESPITTGTNQSVEHSKHDSSSRQARMTSNIVQSPHVASGVEVQGVSVAPARLNIEEGANLARQTFAPTTQGSAVRPSAQPQPGVLIGAGFTPARRRSGLNTRKAASSIEVLPPIKVLIVDDNPINVKILSTWLEKRKIKIGVARDGREAVREWQTGGYHLILMDIQLPVMDGIEATKEIRKLEREASIGTDSSSLGSAGDSSHHSQSEFMSPRTMLNSTLRSSVIIVALTASVLNSDRVAALAAGCNDFLNKPVNMRWLERKVTEWGSMQYLIGFRGAYEGKRNHQARSTDYEDAHREDSLTRRAFGHDVTGRARLVADRLHIGDRNGTLSC